jgi:hypothetical protein
VNIINVKVEYGILPNGSEPSQRARTLSANRIIRRAPGPEEQQAETYRWQSLPIGARLSAVWDVSAAAYAFAAAFKEELLNDARRPQRTITRIQRSGS